jgi:hypothetical protein
MKCAKCGEPLNVGAKLSVYLQGETNTELQFECDNGECDAHYSTWVEHDNWTLNNPETTPKKAGVLSRKEKPRRKDYPHAGIITVRISKPSSHVPEVDRPASIRPMDYKENIEYHQKEMRQAKHAVARRAHEASIAAFSEHTSWAHEKASRLHGKACDFYARQKGKNYNPLVAELHAELERSHVGFETMYAREEP